MIRVDGFRGGKLPPKSQVRSIRFSSAMFGAENHSAGHTFVDIATQPGLGPMRGSMDVSFRDESLNARNAFQSQKGPEQTQQYNLNLSGTILKERTSFSLSAGRASMYDSAYIYAAVPSRPVSGAVRRPSDRLNFNLRVDHALNKAHTLRGSFQQNDNDLGNLGVGNYDLPARAFDRTSGDSMLRLSESGPIARLWFAESRLQVRRTSSDSVSDTQLPTVRVLDAFTAGGAQQAGGRRGTDIEYATDIDYAKKGHSLRMGTLIEGGRYRGDNRTNYLGTFTFTSLADYDAGRPANFTRRAGDPLVEYSQWQGAFYIQDDWRARKNLTINWGVREEFQTHQIRFETIVDTLACAIIKRLSEGRRDGVAIIAEGLVLSLDPEVLGGLSKVERDAHGNVRIAEVNIGGLLKAAVQARLKQLGIDTTIAAKNIGYELRCADPIPFDLEYTRDLGYCATKYLLEGGNAAMISIQAGNFVPVPFQALLDPATGRAKIRMVDIRSTRYAIARRYMIRLRRDDFEDPITLGQIATTAGMSVADFRKEFEYLIDTELPPIVLGVKR
jgi:hypothetical protein